MSKYSQPEYIETERLVNALEDPTPGLRALAKTIAYLGKPPSGWDGLRIKVYMWLGMTARAQRVILDHIIKERHIERR